MMASIERNEERDSFSEEWEMYLAEEETEEPSELSQNIDLDDIVARHHAEDVAWRRADQGLEMRWNRTKNRFATQIMSSNRSHKS